MKKIWKFPIDPNSVEDKWETIEVEMPYGAKPLHVGSKDDRVYIWAEVDPDEFRKQSKFFYSIGTGHGAVPPDSTYFGTVFQDGYVWHIYQDIE